jgi:ubiquinol oxidase
MISPRIVHRFVGKLEEEAVRTYTFAIDEIEKGNLPEWWVFFFWFGFVTQVGAQTSLTLPLLFLRRTQPAPDIAKQYWRMNADATMLDLIYAVRLDEAGHRYVLSFPRSGFVCLFLFPSRGKLTWRFDVD